MHFCRSQKFYERKYKKMAEQIKGSQRAYLRSLANGLSAVFQIGKGGINDNFINQIDEALSVRELIKISLLETCELTTKEAMELLCESTGALPVQQIGRKIVLYRQADKEENRKIVLPKVSKK